MCMDALEIARDACMSVYLKNIKWSNSCYVA